MKTGTSEQLFTLPDSVKDNVTVEYFSSDEKSATYADGKATALKEGKVTVTAIVTAKATGYNEEYSTALEIADNVYEAAEATDGPLTIRESEINQLLTEDLALPTQIDGADASTRENRTDGIVLVHLIVEIELAAEALAIFGDDNASTLIRRDNVGDQISVQQLALIVDRKKLTHSEKLLYL